MFPLAAPTRSSWLPEVLADLEALLVDHAHCEKKAASTAMALIYRYPEYPEMMAPLSRLAREELHHFEQVLKLMKKRGITYEHVSPSRYAKGMRDCMRHHEPAKLIDTLIIGAFIEARSCERFAKLAPYVDKRLGDFYISLLRSEARHYQDYLLLAQDISEFDITERIKFFGGIEADLITSADEDFKFHSGVPSP